MAPLRRGRLARATYPAALAPRCARPVILPEPATRTDAATCAKWAQSIDVDVVLFEPATHLKGCRIELIGTASGRRYRFDTRANANGKRIPLRVKSP